MGDYVFLHGGRQGGWVWTETILAICRQTTGKAGKFLVLDIPGCGTKRSRDTNQLSFDDVVAEMEKDILDAGIEDAVIVGHSQAGTIIPALLARLPNRFCRAIYVSCSAPAPGKTVRQQMGESIRGAVSDEVGWPIDPTGEPDLFHAAIFCNDMSPKETDRFIAKLGKDHWPTACQAHDAWSYAGAGQTPATYIVCLRDEALPPVWQEQFAVRLGASRRILLDAGHQAMNTRPYALAELLLHEARL